MLRGAVKEAGLLALINDHIARRTGNAPLGEHFNARSAPTGHTELLELCQRSIPVNTCRCWWGWATPSPQSPMARAAGAAAAAIGAS